ncbi:MAG: cadmium-translocating P-type ATPase [Elusimicrobia bacterium]|nr:cadmium-translocating P-type ATPase [Elusimicrobiota bacterium]
MGEYALAAAAAAGIALHLLLRLTPASAFARAAPLVLVVVLGGIPLVLRIARRLLLGDLGSDMLAGVSIVAAAAMGQFLVAAIIVLMLSGGQALECAASRRASSVLDALARRMPQVAHRRGPSGLIDVAVAEISAGDELVVLPHELCPADGTVLEGRGSMDEAYLTGEPYQIEKAPGSAVLSGAVNGARALVVRAGRRAADSRYAGIMRVMKDVESGRPRLRRLGDRLAAFYTPLALAIAAAAWAATGESGRFLAVIVVATPCPLLIAIPVAVVGAISLAASRGIIIKNPAILERIGRCRTVILDKTGTLTFGRPSLTEILPLAGAEGAEALRLAASLERYSRHPLAGAVVAGAESRGLALEDASGVSEEAGRGLSGVVAGRDVRVVGRGSVAAHWLAALPPVTPGLECVVLIDGSPAATLRFRDEARPESRPFLAHLTPKHGVDRVLIVSGDRESAVRDLARSVGVREVRAERTPEQKLSIVRAETAAAQTLFVGDGINDAPALAAASVGVAIGRDSDVSAEAAGAVIITASIEKVDELIHIGERMRRIALQSAIGGMALSAAGMALAAVGRLSPLEGAILQEIIDLAAVLNAVRAALPPRDLTDF